MLQPGDRRATRVGAIASAALVAGVAAVLLLDAGDLVPSIRVQVLFSHPGALEPGAEVQLGHLVVGEVESLVYLPAERLAPDHPLAGTGGVAARVRLDDDARPWARINGDYFLAPKGLLGALTMHIAPPPADQELGRPLEDGDVVRGSDPARIDRLIVIGFETTETAREIFASLAPEVAELRATLERLRATVHAAQTHPDDLARLEAATDAFSAELDRLDQLAGEVSLDDLVRLARRADAFAEAAGDELGALGERITAVDAALDRLGDRVPDDLGARLASVITRLRNVDAEFRTMRRHADDLVALVENGRGTIGAIMNDPEFADQAKELGKIIKRQPWRIIARPLSE